MVAYEDGLDSGREALRRFLTGDDTMQTMLTTLARIAVDSVPGTTMGSITIMTRTRPMTPVHTDDRALALDEAQYANGLGPCLAAIEHRGIERASIASCEEIWPAFTAAAREHGVRSVLSTPILAGEAAVGGLNLYSMTVPNFSDDGVRSAALFADQMGVAAARALLYAEGYELAQQLQVAMESRAVIEQAKGILIGEQRVSPQEAFDILRMASQRENRKVRAIAAEIVERHARGEARPSPSRE
jgi:GAF domain-containing protein